MKVKYQKEDIFRIARRNAMEKCILFQAEIDITSACNAKCFFCYQGDCHKVKKNELSTEEVENLLDELKAMGCYYVSFIGGEPFMRKDMLDILEYAKKIGLLISVVTNLQLLNEEQIFRICDIGVDRISVSFHSVNPDKYCKIFGVDERYYNVAMHNIKLLIEKNVNIGILVTISDMNFGEMDDIRDFFIHNGIKERNVAFNMLVSGNNEVRDRRPNKEYENILRNGNVPVESILTKSEVFTCTAGKISCSINSVGDVFPCTFMNCPAGNIREESLKYIWEKSHFMQFVRSTREEHFPRCNRCKNRFYCHVCMANNLNETGLYNIPHEEYCDFRKMLTRSLINEC